jgi:hypothetical protein
LTTAYLKYIYKSIGYNLPEIATTFVIINANRFHNPFFMINMPNYNPFLHSNPVPPEHFRGRKSERRRIVGRIVNAGESTSITGPFRCGKTSLLQYVSDSSLKSTLYGDRANQLIFSSLDIGTLGSEFDQAQFWSRALETFQDHINTNDIAPSLSEAYQVCQQNQFGNYVLEKLIAEIKKANLRLVLLLDGFDGLLHHKLNSTEFFGGLRQLASLSKGALALLITGNTPLAQLNQQTQYFNRTGSPYFNFMDEVILGALTEGEIDELLRLADDRFTEDDRRFIKDIAGGHPYLLQLTASILWDIYEDGDEGEAMERQQSAGRVLYDQVKEKLDKTWKSWDENMQKVFVSIALVSLEKPLKIRHIDVKSISQEINRYKMELDNLERYGFLKTDEKENRQVYPGIFLRFIGDKVKPKYRGKQPDEKISKLSSFLRKVGL